MGSLGARGAGPCGRICIKLHRNYLGSIQDNILKFHGDRLDGLAAHKLQTYIYTILDGVMLNFLLLENHFKHAFKCRILPENVLKILYRLISLYILSSPPDISSALQLLEHIQLTINQSDDAKLQAQTADDLNFLISSLENPILRSIVTIQDSLGELSHQLQQHPSILPVDFDIGIGGDLILSVPPPVYEADFPPDAIRSEFDDQRVPVAKLSQSSSGDSPSPQIISPALEDTSLPPITTPTYAIEFQKAIEQSSRGRDVQTIKLLKPDGGSLGFSVVGLKSEFEGELGIFVQEIQPTSVAGRDGRLHEGDQILAIDGQPLDSNITHFQAINILQKARGLVELVIAHYDCPPSPRPASAVSDSSKAGSDMLNTEWAQVEVIDLVNDGSGLGFGIIGGRSTGVVVKTILPGGVADRDGRLQSGDHILQIGEVQLRGLGSEQVASVLRQSGSHVRLVVARPVDSTAPLPPTLQCQAPVVPTRLLADPEELDRHLAQAGYPTTAAVYTPLDHDHDEQGPDSLVMDVVRPPLPSTPAPLLSSAPSLPLLTLDMLPPQTQLPEMDKFTVEIQKDSHGLGITIAGYVCEKEDLSGIFVKSISEGSAADLCKKIQVNDRIVEVDGRSLQGYSNFQAVDLLRATGQTVQLTLERYLRGPKWEQLQQAIANHELKPPTPTSPSATSLPKYQLSTDGESGEVEPESLTTMDSLVLAEAANMDVALDDAELMIDAEYEGPLQPAVEAAIIAKWQGILGPDVEIVVGQLCKFGEGGGLGISLEGTVDVEDGQEVRPHHYIRSILPEGPVGQNGRLKSGDELLEVNGHRLLGMNHIEVVSILKDLPVNVRMVCARRSPDSTPYRLIDTSQDKNAFAARSILGGSLQNLLPAMERLVKAKSDGSLASTATEPSLSKLKSRSLEPLTGLAMWSSEPHIIELVKGERGLGFSILDYQDPMNPSETVIVIRSLVPGGVAQVDGRLIPGDRLLSVNDTALDHASLDQAVQALKGAPKGPVTITVAKPLPIPDSVSQSECQEFLEGLSQATPTLDDHSMYSCSGSLPEDLDQDEPPALPSSPPPDSCLDLLSDDEMLLSRTPDTLLSEEGVVDLDTDKVPLPADLEQEIKVHKGSEPLGITLDCDGEGDAQCGMVVTEVIEGGAVAKDGRLKPGDLILSLNYENLRRVTPAQGRAILRRAQLITTDIHVKFVPAPTTLDYRKSSLHGESLVAPIKSTVITQISPRSPYINQEVCVQQLPSAPLSPTSVLSETNEPESFVDCDSRRTDSLDDEVNQAVECETRTEVTSGDDEVDSASNLEKPLSVDSVVSVGSDSEVGRRTSVIDPPSGFQTSTPSSKENLDVSEVVLQVEESLAPEPTQPTVNEVPSWTRTDLRTSAKLFRGQSVDVEVTSAATLLRRGQLLRSASTGQETEAVTGNMTVSNPSASQSQSSVLLAKHWGPERSVRVLREPNCSLGISIVGGKVDLYNAGPDSGSAISGIFIKNVLPQSPAGRTNELKTGDRILEVDGIDLRTASHERAVDVIRAAGNPVHFLVQSLVQWSVDGEQEGAARKRAPAPPSPTGELLKATPYPIPEARTPTPELIQVNNHQDGWTDSRRQSFQDRRSSKRVAPKPQAQPPQPQPKRQASVKKYSSDSDSDDDEEDTREMEGRIYTKKGAEIYRASAGNVKRTKEEIEADPEEEDDFGYTNNKVKKKYGNLGPGVLMVQLEKGPQGLGLSLAGHKDRTRMAVFVCGINPRGSAHKTGAIHVGDEILEVNGVVLHGRCHLNASAIIKGLPGTVFKVIVLRKDQGLDNLAVKPITQFPVSLDDETPEQKYASFKGLRTVAIKKSSCTESGVATSPTQQSGPGLGIMIIEGKHAEVGQGIFISDIQEGSAAEQAGLVVGDMILAVNKDTLLGSNYDAAAALLKKTEGVVSLVVCNPNKAKAEEQGATATADSAPKSPTPQPPKEPEKPRLACKPVVDGMVGLAEEPPPDPATAPVVPGKECTIEINKDKMGLGLSIVGGSDTLLGVIIIHEVYPDGAAAKDGRLKPGDQVLEVNSEDFRSISHSKALAALRQTPAKVKMVVLRDEGVVSGKDEELMDIMEVELTKKPGKGLGLSIVGRKSGPGIFISDVVQGGTAGTDGRLMKGDQILVVNGQDLKNSTQEEAAAVLKTAAGKVTMKLGRLKASESGTSGSEEESVESWRTVELHRGPEGLGFSVVGGHQSPHGDLPIYVKTVYGAAAGQLKHGDQILTVDGISLLGLTHQQAVALLKSANPTVTLTIQS